METKSKKKFVPDKRLKLLDQVRETLRYYHYALSTEKIYCQWIFRYIVFYGKKRHPCDMGAKEVERFLSHLASKEKVAVATQKQALGYLAKLPSNLISMLLELKLKF